MACWKYALFECRNGTKRQLRQVLAQVALQVSEDTCHVWRSHHCGFGLCTVSSYMFVYPNASSKSILSRCSG